MRPTIKTLLATPNIGSEATVMGWVRHRRGSKSVFFVIINDGSTLDTLQIVVDSANFNEDPLRRITTGACIQATGTLIQSQGAGQAVELNATALTILGDADAEKYPLQPKAHSLEFLREIAHLRPRTNTFGAIFRVRHALAYAIHQYFNEQGFFYWHSPIITASDAEGAGQMFRVTTFEGRNAPIDENGHTDYKQDFFGAETSLTVSGQLEGELGAMGLGRVYTFGPTFRAENSNTTRHLAEFWMIEPEMAFFDLNDNMDLVQDFLRYVIKYALEHCATDLEFLDKRLADEEKNKKQEERGDMGLIEKLRFVVENDFVRLSYTEAIDILLNSPAYKKKKFQYEVAWGVDLQSEHERYLVEKHFKKPVILNNYPRAIKAFYMKQNEGETPGRETVRAMDVLFPGIGEIVGGSQREEDHDRLLARIREVGIDEQNLWWYLDTRKFGTAPHSGFGLGFERLVLFVTGMGNIRDVIPFPRTPQSAKF